MTITFTVPGKPQGQARSRSNPNGGKPYTPEGTKAYRAMAAGYAQLAMRGKQTLDGPVIVTVEARHFPALSMPKRDRERALRGETRPMLKPDGDNVAKAMMDAMNKIVFNDDGQVVYLAFSRVWSAEPCVIVTVEAWRPE